MQVINADLRNEIKQNLEREIASAIGGREARIRASFDEDLQLTEAVSIVRDSKRYKTILTKPAQATVESR